MAPCPGQVVKSMAGLMVFWMFRLLEGLDGVFEKAAIRCDEVVVTITSFRHTFAIC